MILDTSFVIDLFDGRDDAFRKGVELAESSQVQRVPAPVVTELSYGAAFGDETAARRVKNALRMYPVVEQDETVARRAGELLAAADERAGGENGVDRVDPTVAAVADLNGEPVVTDDVTDFQTLGVSVEQY